MRRRTTTYEVQVMLPNSNAFISVERTKDYAFAASAVEKAKGQFAETGTQFQIAEVTNRVVYHWEQWREEAPADEMPEA